MWISIKWLRELVDIILSAAHPYPLPPCKIIQANENTGYLNYVDFYQVVTGTGGY